MLHPAALSDLNYFDPVALVWTDITHQTVGTAPGGRAGPGFVAAGSALYLFGGHDGRGSFSPFSQRVIAHALV